MPSFGHIFALGTALLGTVATAIPVENPTQNDVLLKWAREQTTITDCNLSNAQLPLEKTNPQLPSPPHGHELKHVVIGRGTQNYTCATTNEGSVAPESAGAVATLYDASCLASNSPDILHEITEQINKFDKESLSSFAQVINDITGVNLVEGHHYFDETSTPFFDLREDGCEHWIATDGIQKVPSPNGAVDWLRLGRKDSKGIQEVYRVETQGGQPPANCAGTPETFEIEYAAEYWFYG